MEAPTPAAPMGDLGALPAPAISTVIRFLDRKDGLSLARCNSVFHTEVQVSNSLRRAIACVRCRAILADADSVHRSPAHLQAPRLEMAGRCETLCIGDETAPCIGDTVTLGSGVACPDEVFVRGAVRERRLAAGRHPAGHPDVRVRAIVCRCGADLGWKLEKVWAVFPGGVAAAGEGVPAEGESAMLGKLYVRRASVCLLRQPLQAPGAPPPAPSEGEEDEKYWRGVQVLACRSILPSGEPCATVLCERRALVGERELVLKYGSLQKASDWQTARFSARHVETQLEEREEDRGRIWWEGNSWVAAVPVHCPGCARRVGDRAQVPHVGHPGRHLDTWVFSGKPVQLLTVDHKRTFFA
jgi:hypothetical protein